jgi:DNA-binding NarL/FixJ family response regulator
VSRPFAVEDAALVPDTAHGQRTRPRRSGNISRQRVDRRPALRAQAPRRPLDQLSGREREVLALVAEGLSNQGIATSLFITERTVEAHVKQIFQKLGLNADPGSHRRVLAVLAYLRRPG